MYVLQEATPDMRRALFAVRFGSLQAEAVAASQKEKSEAVHRFKVLLQDKKVTSDSRLFYPHNYPCMQFAQTKQSTDICVFSFLTHHSKPGGTK